MNSLKFKFHIPNSKKGVSLIEGILAAGLLGMIVTALVGLFIYGQESTRVGGERMIATFLAEEGIEAARNIRDAAYANLTNGDHGLDTAGSIYSFSGTSDTVGQFTRVIAISDVSSRKKVISTVTWNISPSRVGSVSLESHFTNWR